MKPKAEYRVGVGASSILMILVVLSLAALSLLSLQAARTNAALTERNLRMTLAYYDAAAEVQRTLAAMDQRRSELDLTSPEGIAAFRTFMMSCALPATLRDDLSFTLLADADADREIVTEGVVTPGESGSIALTRHTLRSTLTDLDSPALNVFMPSTPSQSN
ncbi:MAG: hypothetical protein VB087_11435 [Candidatus Limiplasma sp.]|nr:hypothetical protein [Candidatus Limiplasma sp.]MEA5145511.1 hypothetical protein [Candidatus Limiplasma sp.]